MMKMIFKPLITPEQYPDLNQLQFKAMSDLVLGSNVFLTGAGGTGKSYVIEQYYKKACTMYGSSTVHKTSTTGISAKLINGQTLHSFAGIGLGIDSGPDLAKNIYSGARSRIKNCKVLFIDECSMLSFELFNKLNYIFQTIKNNKGPFGSIQLVMIGDFFQLLPIKSNDFCFESETWLNCMFKTHNLTEIVRQKDPEFQNLLNEVRMGYCSDNTATILESRLNLDFKNEYGILPTRLYPINKTVDEYNNKELQKLLTNKNVENHTYKCTFKVIYNRSKENIDTLFKKINQDNIIPEQITLCIGAQIVFKKNIKGTGIVNGTRAVISSFVNLPGTKIDSALYPVATFIDGNQYIIEPESFSFGVKDLYDIQRIVLPIKLAWAISIHGSQGSSLDYIIMDAGTNIFEFGQVYVGLSRVRSLEGLFLESFDRTKIYANPKVKLFYEQYEKINDNNDNDNNKDKDKDYNDNNNDNDDNNKTK